MREVDLARLVCRLRNDGSQDVDVEGINDGDELAASEALIIVLKSVNAHLATIGEQLEDLG